MLRFAHRSPRAATGVRRRGVRPLVGTAVALAALTVPALISTPSASAAPAGWSGCYRQNSWSFRNYTGSLNSYINAWHNTTCKGSSVLSGQVLYTPSNRNVKINAFDYKADNCGVTVYTHGPSVSSDGAGSSVTGGGDLSSFSTPYNFWIRVCGQENSVSQPFPLT